MAIPGFGALGVQKQSVKEHYDVAIIGAGPAGLSAGIYARRAGLSPIIIDKNLIGGLVIENPLVENYLSQLSIKGEELAALMKRHAKEYADILENEEVLEISHTDNLFKIKTNTHNISSSAIIIATGTTHKKLGIIGEARFLGKGVSYCVTCDAYFFREKTVAVIGGANSGAIAAIYLKNVNVEPVIFEYMPRWMCEDAYVKKLKELKIEYNTNVEVREIGGNDSKVTHIKYVNRSTGEEYTRNVDGVFIYVGLVPQSNLANALNLPLDQKGYIITDKKQRTKVPKVYAAGDITGESGQIIISAAQGAIAALSAYEDLRIKGL